MKSNAKAPSQRMPHNAPLAHASPRTYRAWMHAVIAAAVVLMAVWAPRAAAQTTAPTEPTQEVSASFAADVEALTRHPHRLAGSPEGQDAAAYIEKRLREIGVPTVLSQDVPVWQTVVREAYLEIDGQKLAILPLRPNVVVPPTTPAQGVTAPMIYAGRGDVADYGDRRAKDAIVVLDFATHDAWQRAFAMGARGVVFLRNEADPGPAPKHANVPVNLLRMYVPGVQDGKAGSVDLTQDREQVRLVSRVGWEMSQGRNIVGFIPGLNTQAAAKEPEVLVLAVDYDSFGVVPHMSPAARRAANVAALLAAAQDFTRKPPQRDTAVVFFDNGARMHGGAKQFYNAIHMPAEIDASIVKNHQDEKNATRAMRDRLAAMGLGFDAREDKVSTYLSEALSDTADWRRADLARQLQIDRLRMTRAGVSKQDIEAELQAMTATQYAWDDVRRAVHYNQLAALVTAVKDPSGENIAVLEEADISATDTAKLGRLRELFETLQSATAARFNTRLAELEQEMRQDQQRADLREVLGYEAENAYQPKLIVLHASFDLSDASDTFSLVANDATYNLYVAGTPADADDPGFYNRLLSVLERVSTKLDLPALDRLTLADPNAGARFAPTQRVHSGAIAGIHRFYNLAVVTGYDALPREGQPSDTVDRLNLAVISAQARQATMLLKAAANSPELSIARSFRVMATSKYAAWNDYRTTGDFVTLRVLGGLAEKRPAPGAMMALWPGGSNSPGVSWANLAENILPAYDTFNLVPVNLHGRYDLVAFHKELEKNITTFAVLPAPDSGISAMTTQGQLGQASKGAMRTDLISGKGHVLVSMPTFAANPDLLQVLQSTSDTRFRENLALWGQEDAYTFFFLSDQIVDRMVKVFQQMGPVALGSPASKGDQSSASNGELTGIPAEQLESPPNFAPIAAHDAWELNEQRLNIMRERSVSVPALERLHGRAKRELDTAEDAAGLADRMSGFLRSNNISQRVYPELRAAMDDLVWSVVILLLLAIPFAFGMERLLVGATSIYGRIGGFTGLFLLTFARCTSCTQALPLHRRR